MRDRECHVGTAGIGQGLAEGCIQGAVKLLEIGVFDACYIGLQQGGIVGLLHFQAQRRALEANMHIKKMVSV